MREVPATPVLLVYGSRESPSEISHSPYTVGRMPGSDLQLEDAFISRQHAEILFEDDSFYVVDQDSKQGTFLNGSRVTRHELSKNDTIHFGKLDGPLLLFGVRAAESRSTLRELLGPLKVDASPNIAFEKLSWLLEAIRKLNNVGAVDQILTGWSKPRWLLTKVERGYVMLTRSGKRRAEGDGRPCSGGRFSTMIPRSHIPRSNRRSAELGTLSLRIH